MTDKEKHGTIKRMKNEGVIFGSMGLIIIALACAFFVLDQFDFGLISLSISVFLFFMCLLVAIKIHARYTQVLILKLNNKTWEDLCDCYECVQKRGSQSYPSGSGEKK